MTHPLFPHFPDTAKVWIYQSKTLLDASQLEFIQQEGSKFLKHWTSHEEPVDAALDLPYGYFVIFAVNTDLTKPGGCSLDKLLQFVQQLEQKLKIQLLDRTQVCYIAESQEDKSSRDSSNIQSCSLKEFEQRIKMGSVTPNTLVFNNVVETKQGLNHAWLIPVGQSWHKRLL